MWKIQILFFEIFWNLFFNIFYPQPVKSTDAEPVDMEGQLKFKNINRAFFFWPRWN